MPPPPLDGPTAVALARLIGTFVILILAGLVTTTLPLPMRLGSLAFTIAAITVGIHTLRRARRAGAAEQLSLVLGFGIAFAVLTGVSMMGTVILWPVEMAHQECLSRAVTIAATATCETAYEDGVQARIDELTRRP